MRIKMKLINNRLSKIEEAVGINSKPETLADVLSKTDMLSFLVSLKMGGKEGLKEYSRLPEEDQAFLANLLNEMNESDEFKKSTKND
jgi:hypothetical protein